MNGLRIRQGMTRVHDGAVMLYMFFFFLLKSFLLHKYSTSLSKPASTFFFPFSMPVNFFWFSFDSRFDVKIVPNIQERSGPTTM